MEPLRAVRGGHRQLGTTVRPQQAKRIGSWSYWGYKLNRSEMNAIAGVSLWTAARGVSSTCLIPYSGAITAFYSVNCVLAARNARSMGTCPRDS